MNDANASEGSSRNPSISTIGDQSQHSEVPPPYGAHTSDTQHPQPVHDTDSTVHGDSFTPVDESITPTAPRVNAAQLSAALAAVNLQTSSSIGHQSDDVPLLQGEPPRWTKGLNASDDESQVSDRFEELEADPGQDGDGDVVHTASSPTPTGPNPGTVRTPPYRVRSYSFPIAVRVTSRPPPPPPGIPATADAALFAALNPPRSRCLCGCTMM